MALSAGQLPDQPGVNGAKKRFAGFDLFFDFRHIFKIPVQHQGGINRRYCPACGLARFFSPFTVINFLTQGRGAVILPDNGVVQRHAGIFIPDQAGSPLVGNADGRDLFWRHAA